MIKWTLGIIGSIIIGVGTYWLTVGWQPPPVVDPQSSLTSERDTDRFGNDYDIIRNIKHEECRSLCLRDSRCRAYTYDHDPNSPDYEDCFLKDRVPQATQKVGDISGVKRP